MIRKMVRALWVVVLLALPALGQTPSREGTPRNIVLVGWDGAQRAHVKECLARGELPTLKKLSEEGGLVDIDVITGATDTKAGWTQILTGCHPQVTGVFSNGRFRDVPAGLSVFERLKEHFGPEQLVCAAVIGKSSHCGEIRAPFKRKLDDKTPVEMLPQPKRAKQKPGDKQPARRPLGTIIEEDGVKYQVFEGSPYYTMHKSCDAWNYGLMLDEKVGARTIQLLEKYKDKPFFFFVHFAEVDHLG